ncbi:MAG: hypothetical protein RLZZ157_639 [Pseudomonadota bacterium]|jgi:hypothetical protein
MFGEGAHIRINKSCAGIARSRALATACRIGLALLPMLATPQLAQAQAGVFDAMSSDANRAAPQAVSFSTDMQNLRFVIDRSASRHVLLQFEGDPEVWALTSHWGPRGDEFLRNDVGDVMVRITSLGGVIVYGPLGSAGGPAARLGKARNLAAPTRQIGSLQTTVEKALRWFSRFGDHQIRVEAAGGLAPSLVYEALQRASDGMSRAPSGMFGQPKVKLIRVERAAGRANVTWQKGVLTIGVVPGAGYAGRPSSAAVLAALAERR